ncbi:MAG: orotate phosphoribosyltransferase [Candidatus Jordarchaeum sp.]|uniref:orotate phosphoribosyltransferase n=1 Tax=Candidatus Jordarchaeum sp. TaxID=2823881 RepID=UPI004049586B
MSREELKRLILERGVVTGKPVILSSTRMSTFYFNLRPIALDPVGCRLIAEIMIPLIKKYEVDCVGGTEDSSLPIISAICALGGIPGFYVRKQTQKYGLREHIEGNLGKKAVLVDDVATSGESLLYVAKAIREVGCDVEHAITIVDLLEGAKERLATQRIKHESIFDRDDFKH